MNDVLVVLPTYDEAANLERVVGGILAETEGVDVLVVDDASPDGTGAVADTLAARDPRVHVLHRPAKDGLGVAYRAGFRWGADRSYHIFVQMDADGSHQPRQLPVLLAALRPDVDLVLGSRWVPGGEVVDWSRRRELLSRAANAYVRLVLGIDVRDSTGGYRVYRGGTLDRIALTEVRSQGYCFQVDMTRRTLAAGCRVVEVPISFVERAFGRSKMSLPIVAEALWRVTAWGAARLPTSARDRGPAGRTARAAMAAERR